MGKNMPSFEETLKICVNNQDLIREYERLYFGGKDKIIRHDLIGIIDKSTGYRQKKFNDFANFVRDYIWLPAMREYVQGLVAR